MSEEQEAAANEEESGTASEEKSQSGYTDAEVREMIEKETQGLKSKVEELLGESKSAKQKAKELEEEKERQEAERLEKEQQFKELYEREQKSKQELAEKYEDFQRRIQKQEIDLNTQNIAGELTRDTARAELLAEKAAQFAHYDDENGVTFEIGGIPANKEKVVEHLKEKYPFLADGSGASGGGATGSGGSAPSKKPEEFTEQERVDLYKQDPEKFRQIFKSH